VRPGPQRLRVRGYAHELAFAQGRPVTVELSANGVRLLRQTLDRSGLFVLEASVPEAPAYHIGIAASPAWIAPGEDRVFTVNISGIRLVPAE
jgi:hypothetical protein